MNHLCTRENCQGCQGRYLCNCLRVTEKTVVTLLASGAVHSVRELRAMTGAGDGCTACHERLSRYVDRFTLTMAPMAAAG
jgi:bacterioferritin-associated ferredoxin